jgi:hypothetical protein
MRPVAVVVLNVLMDDGFEVASTDDEHAIDALQVDGPDEAFGECIGPGTLIGVRMVRISSERTTSSKLVVNFGVAIRIKNLTGRARWASS